MNTIAEAPGAENRAAGQDPLIIFNPTAGRRRRRRLAALLKALRRRGKRPRLVTTIGPADATAIVARAAAGHSTKVIAVAGGDGTANEAVNGLAESGGGAPPLAILPFGTVNLLAGELGTPAGSAAQAALLAGAGQAPLAVAWILPGLVNDRRFTVTAGVGFDARTVARVSTGMKRRWGRLAYAVAALAELRRGGFPDLDVTVDGRRQHCNGLLVAKGRYYAGRMVWAPDARVGDPVLWVGLFRARTRWRVAGAALAVALGLARHWPGVTVCRAGVVTVAGPPGEPVQADGDIVARLPVRFTVDRTPIAVVVPGPADQPAVA